MLPNPPQGSCTLHGEYNMITHCCLSLLTLTLLLLSKVQQHQQLPYRRLYDQKVLHGKAQGLTTAIQVELRSGQSETVLGANLKSNPSHWSFLFLKFTA